MVTVVCSIVIAVQSFVPVMVRADVSGTLLKEGITKYLVDFSKDLSNTKKYSLVGKPEDYSKVLVDKKDCVK
jgi:hypothetical protein